MPVATWIDLVGIQPFIFTSNRLRDAAGGSGIVLQATSNQEWVTGRWLKLESLEDRALFPGGGNIVLESSNLDEAREMVARLSHRAIKEAPGLEMAVAHCSWGDGGEARTFSQAIQKLQWDIEAANLSRKPNIALPGLGVTARCRYTDLPATELDRDGEPISRAIRIRRPEESRPPYDTTWDYFLPPDAGQFSLPGGPKVRLCFPMELDDLGRTRSDTSYIGVVHVDGNSVGRAITNWLNKMEGASNEKVSEQYHELAEDLNRVSEKSLRTIVDRVVQSIGLQEGQHGKSPFYVLRSRALQQDFPINPPKQLPPEEYSNSSIRCLPLRPLILGGDDLTFVCDGRIALDLAETAVRAFRDYHPKALPEPLTACAGVALVRSHAPFSLAYRMAEELTKLAKRRYKESVALGSGDAIGALDWQIGLPPSGANIEAIREQYQQEEKQQPYLIYRDGVAPDREGWEWLSRTLLGTNPSSPKGFNSSRWAEHRNKAIDLRDMLLEGGNYDDLDRRLGAWRVANPNLELPDGWDLSTLRDALDLQDLYWPLAPEESTPPGDQS